MYVLPLMYLVISCRYHQHAIVLPGRMHCATPHLHTADHIAIPVLYSLER